jgi:putative tryptophan/tyrosine transport system substrate-binding protein
MTRKFLSLLLTTFFLATASSANAQQPKKVSRIGVLRAGSPSSNAAQREAFRQGLRDLGYIEGQNLVVENRYAEGADEFPNLATELVRLKVDVIVVAGTAGAQAAKNATTTIPIVFTGVGDPVGTGVVASLARPGGNVTGFSNLTPELAGKQMEVLKEALPKISRVAVLSETANAGNAVSLREMKVAAEALRITLQPLEFRSADDFEPAFSAIKREHASALIVLRGPVINTHRTQIVDLAAKSRLPAMYPDKVFTDAGGLMSYGPDPFEQFRDAARYVDKILKGAKPADLPVEQAMKVEFVINLKTAKQIGLTIPPNVLARADKVIK